MFCASPKVGLFLEMCLTKTCLVPNLRLFGLSDSTFVVRVKEVQRSLQHTGKSAALRALSLQAGGAGLGEVFQGSRRLWKEF